MPGAEVEGTLRKEKKVTVSKPAIASLLRVFIYRRILISFLFLFLFLRFAVLLFLGALCSYFAFFFEASEAPTPAATATATMMSDRIVKIIQKILRRMPMIVRFSGVGCSSCGGLLLSLLVSSPEAVFSERGMPLASPLALALPLPLPLAFSILAGM